MTAIELFKKYMNRYWSELMNDNWMVSVTTFKRSNIFHEKLKELIPDDLEYGRCLVFYNSEEKRNEVYLFQDERGEKNLAITFMTDDILVHAIAIETL